MSQAPLSLPIGEPSDPADPARTLLEAAPVLICALDTESRILQLTPYWEKILGYPDTELLGTSFLSLVHSDERSAVSSRLSDLASGAPARPYECRLRHANGFDRRMRCEARRDRSTGRLVLVAHDISGDRHEKDALRREHRLWNSLVESSPDNILMLDLEGRILYMNRTITGRPVAEVVGSSLFAQVPESFHPTLRQSIERVCATGRRDRCSFEYEVPGQPLAVLELRISPIERNGEVTALAVNLTDITTSRRALEDLERSRSRLKAFLSALDDLALEISRDGVLLNIWARNPKSHRLPRESFPGSLLHEILPDDVARRLLAVIRELLDDPSARRRTVEYALDDDEGGAAIFSADLTVIQHGVIQHGGRKPAPSIACLIRDITSTRHDASERDRMIRQLETHTADLEELAYTAWHDFKNPLTTMGNYLGRVRQDLAAGRTTHLAKDLDRIDAACQQLATLLDALWTLSRSERFKDEPREVALLEVLQEAIDMVAQPVGRRQAHLKIAASLPTLHAHPVHLHQIFQHLIDNALKFIGDVAQPEIEIGTRRQAPGEQRAFYVRDNGPGISPRYHDKIFNLFDQLDPSSSGSGFGLALVKRLVESYGGEIRVESEGDGTGSTFLFTLPQAELP